MTNLQHDVPAATAFYEELFGWETESGPDGLPPYALGRLRGRDVAAIGTMPDPAAPPAWVMEVRVEVVGRHGGTVLQGPFDAPPAFTQAIVADPGGAVLSISQLRPELL